MWSSSVLTALLACVSTCAALPARIERRAITQALFDDLNLFEQFAAAAYCPSNNDSPSTKLTCAAGNCPLVEADNTTTLAEFENTALTDATGYVATDDTRELVVVAFRGTESIRNFITDAEFPQGPTDICDGCEASLGFWRSWLEARGTILAAVRQVADSHPGYGLVVVGHSLGGAIADLAAAQLRNDGYETALYTYGAPRIGGEAISSFITNQPGGNFRVTHVDDPVPQLPPVFLGFVHVSPECYIRTGNGVPVTSEDVTQFRGAVNDGGNTGNFSLDIEAHGWYFNDITACFSGDLIEI